MSDHIRVRVWMDGNVERIKLISEKPGTRSSSLVLRPKDYLQLMALSGVITKFLSGLDKTQTEWWLTQKNSSGGVKVVLKTRLSQPVVHLIYVWRVSGFDNWHSTKQSVSMCKATWESFILLQGRITSCLVSLNNVKPTMNAMYRHMTEMCCEQIRKVYKPKNVIILCSAITSILKPAVIHSVVNNGRILKMFNNPDCASSYVKGVEVYDLSHLLSECLKNVEYLRCLVTKSYWSMNGFSEKAIDE
jgi:hypothetical protein